MIEPPFRERFDRPALNPALRWHCEPARWGVDPARPCLWIEPDAGTDFWQRTHYGFEADNGHFLFATAAGDFALETKVTLRPVHQYDQAGLMVRVSPSCWLKTSVEYEPEGPGLLGAVVTNAGYSDWSTQEVPRGLEDVWFRVRMEAGDCLVDASLDGRDWRQIRMARLLERRGDLTVDCGPYACSPKGAGFRAEFHFLDFTPGRSASP
jgi:regulation of enolase protein 1 (concanavalin A-like superfamily)